ncbi:6-phosphofructokinase [Desulfuribacillus alkaliarsenatis]|uniref:ATP-dependent 6-phosphofructokinase n=1 Tax=Desulfuribacillus alkaliarsenatis TaxID=766136 RepID=A0A1E5G179_9FIRM|nr:ATP-dependent 6-phosphofructokinase [Desulfuribacillus alkaliarsenatis]OEF96580.1 6-phosphofructokinase [Desulfuribacillus alkaliarsenatis]
MKIKRIGVLTGGGDCPGLNAVIRAVVKTAIRQYNYEVVGFINGFAGMIKKEYRLLTEQEVSGILHRGGTILGTTNRDNPFRYAVKENGELVFKDVSEQAIANLQELGVDALVVIGGDGSLAIANEFYQKGLPVVGIPKTIDNDLSATDTTFGFDTALTTASEAIDKLHTTAESHHRVMVLEVMGRYAGWIALHAGIAGGADVILIPEKPFTIEGACAKIKERASKGKKFSIVVVAEGATIKDGELVVQRVVKESHDSIRLGGIGNQIGEAIEACTGMETRVTVLGHLQRGGSPTAFDRILSTRYGVGGVDLVAQDKFGQMVALKGTDIVGVTLESAVSQLKKVDPDGELVHAAESVGICFG